MPGESATCGDYNSYAFCFACEAAGAREASGIPHALRLSEGLRFRHSPGAIRAAEGADVRDVAV